MKTNLYNSEGIITTVISQCTWNGFAHFFRTKKRQRQSQTPMVEGRLILKKISISFFLLVILIQFYRDIRLFNMERFCFDVYKGTCFTTEGLYQRIYQSQICCWEKLFDLRQQMLSQMHLEGKGQNISNGKTKKLIMNMK